MSSGKRCFFGALHCPGDLFSVCLLVFLLLLAAPSAEAAKRVGLVIGNDAYANLPPDRQLKKAINDAKAMRDTLERDLGFHVFYGENADYRRMNALLTELETATEAGDIVFVFFSGHGVSVGAENYLMPSDVPKPTVDEEARLAGNSFGADALTRRLQKKGARAIFAVLDACRDNPFETVGGKAAGGLGGLQNLNAAKGVFMLFAAGLGQVALDRLADSDPDPNSVFTRSLIPLLKQGGLSQVDLAKAVQGKVAALAAQIGHVQEPAYYDQILGFVELKEAASTKTETEVGSKTAFEEVSDNDMIKLAAHVAVTTGDDEDVLLCLLHKDASSVARAFETGGDELALRIAAQLITTGRCGRVAGVGYNTRDGRASEACPTRGKVKEQCVGVQYAYAEDLRVEEGKALHGYVVVTTGYPEPDPTKNLTWERWALAE
jgi:hypothetical protein